MRDALVSQSINSKYDKKIEMVNTDDKVCSMWGMDAIYITREQIKELLDGKVGYSEDGEYAQLLYLKDE